MLQAFIDNALRAKSFVGKLRSAGTRLQLVAYSLQLNTSRKTSSSKLAAPSSRLLSSLTKFKYYKFVFQISEQEKKTE